MQFAVKFNFTFFCALKRRCLANVSTSSAEVSTTIHKDGTVTYHFNGGVIPEDAVFSNFTGPKEVLEIPEGPLKASNAGDYKNVANGVSGSEVAPPELAALSGVHPSSFTDELNGNSHQSPGKLLNGTKQLETAKNGAHHTNGTADLNGFAKHLNGGSANALLQLDASTLLGPRQEQDRSRQHQRAGFSGRFVEVHLRLCFLCSKFCLSMRAEACVNITFSHRHPQGVTGISCHVVARASMHSPRRTKGLVSQRCWREWQM